MRTEIKNAVIENVTFDTERGLSMWVYLDYGGSGQGFGGYMLYGPKGWGCHNTTNIAGHFIWRILEVSGVSDINKMKGKAVRAKVEDGLVVALGHIIKENWFEPRIEFKELLENKE